MERIGAARRQRRHQGPPGVHRPFRYVPPPPAATAVLRPRLLRVLARRFDLRLVTIEAGAGLGKTTLLSQAVAEPRRPGHGRDCWFTCEPADSTASTLLSGLLEAVGGEAGAAPPAVHDVCEAVWAAAPQQVCLVIDDAHLVDPGSEGEGVLRQLVDDLPANGHLVIAARHLPVLGRSRLLTQGRSAELNGDALRLIGDEVAAVAGAHGIATQTLVGACGWPALAELHARTGRAHAERFAWEEVVAPLLPAERQAFLAAVAVGGADAEMLTLLVEEPFDYERLVALPLVSGDGFGGLWPHPLWEELLRRRIPAARAAADRRRLAAALAGRGDHGAAFELLAAAGDWDPALEALFAATNDQHQPPWRDQMHRWRRLVPPSLAHAPEVVYLDAMIGRATDPWADAASRRFVAAIEGFRRRGDVVREAIVAVRAAHVAWMREDRPFLEAMAARATELIAAGLPLEPIYTINRLVVADLDGRWEDMVALADCTAEVEPRLRHFNPIFHVVARLAQGDADAAVDAAARAASAAAPLEPAAGSGWALSLPAFVAWARGDLTAVLAAVPSDPGARHSIAERVPAMALAAVVAAHVGNTARAAELVADIDHLVPDGARRGFLAGFRAVAAAAAAIASGDEDGARRALALGLSGHPLTPTGAGRAVHWLPSMAYLFHPAAREMLDESGSGPARSRTLDACRALLAARDGKPGRTPALCDDPSALLTALPAPLATELIVRAAAAEPMPRFEGAVAGLADLAPAATRDALHALSADHDPTVRRAARALLATVPIPPPHRVRIEVHGPARLLVDGAVVDDPNWRRQRVRQLVCALVAHREIRRSRLGTLLWPEFDEDAVSANLRMTLSYVQALLEPYRSRGDAPWFLQQGSGLLRLRADDHLSVDAWDFDASLDAAEAAAAAGMPTVELDHLLAAVELWRGDYLDDMAGEEWAEPLRERARQRFVRAAVRAGDLLVAGGRPHDAVRVAQAATSCDPWSEPACRLLVAAHLAAGDERAAARAFEATRRMLADLGAELEPATQRLGRRVRAAR